MLSSIDLCIYCSELVVWLYAFAFMFLMQQQLFGWIKCKCLVPGSINTTSHAGNLLWFKQNNNRRNKGNHLAWLSGWTTWICVWDLLPLCEDWHSFSLLWPQIYQEDMMRSLLQNSLHVFRAISGMSTDLGWPLSHGPPSAAPPTLLDILSLFPDGP